MNKRLTTEDFDRLTPGTVIIADEFIDSLEYDAGTKFVVDSNQNYDGKGFQFLKLNRISDDGEVGHLLIYMKDSIKHCKIYYKEGDDSGESFIGSLYGA